MKCHNAPPHSLAPTIPSATQAEVLVVPLKGKICDLVPLRRIKPKMTASRVVAVPFKGFKSRNGICC